MYLSISPLALSKSTVPEQLACPARQSVTGGGYQEVDCQGVGQEFRIRGAGFGVRHSSMPERHAQELGGPF